MDSENILPQEDIDKFVEDFMSSLSQAFCKSYADFKFNSTNDLTRISLNLQRALNGFPFFCDKNEKEVLECKQFILTMNVIAAKTNATITVMADEQENRINVGVRKDNLCLDGELLQLFSLAAQTCHKIAVFDSGIYLSYNF